MNDLSNSSLNAVIELYMQAADAFARRLSRSDDVADEVDFTGSLHELAFEAGRVVALGHALVLLTGNTAWARQAAEVVAEYMTGTVLPEEAN